MNSSLIYATPNSVRANKNRPKEFMDAFGNTLKIGDKVIYSNYYGLSKGKIVRFTAQRFVIISYKYGKNNEYETIIYKESSKVCKI